MANEPSKVVHDDEHDDEIQATTVPSNRIRSPNKDVSGATIARRAIFTRLVNIDGQPGVFIPLLTTRERELLEDWFTAKGTGPTGPGSESRYAPAA